MPTSKHSTRASLHKAIRADSLHSTPHGAIPDEIQHVPDLLSYLQVQVDEDPTPGRFILSGSENLNLSRAESQSLAGRTAQEINLSSLGNDCGVSHNTIREWLSLLEAGFIIHRLPPWHSNVTLRWIKSPKLHFVDSGLACALLGIREPGQLATHPLRGAIFETWVVGEILKYRLNRGRTAQALFHMRQTRGLEVDVVIDDGGRLTAAEVKSAATPGASLYANLLSFGQQVADRRHARSAGPTLRLIYGGQQGSIRQGVDIIPWNSVASREW